MFNASQLTQENPVKYLLSLFKTMDDAKKAQILSMKESEFYYEIIVSNVVNTFKGTNGRSEDLKKLEQFFGGLVCKVVNTENSHNLKILVSKVKLPQNYPVSDVIEHVHFNKGKDILLGISSFGVETLSLDSFYHLGIFGNTGYGKTNFLDYFRAQILSSREDVDNVLIDPKNTSKSFANHPRVIRYASSRNEMLSTFYALYTEMAVREYFFTEAFSQVPVDLNEYNQFKKEHKRDDLPSFNKIFVWIDEASEFFGEMDNGQRGMQEVFSKFVFKARSFGIKIIACAQTDGTINYQLRKQLDCKLFFPVIRYYADDGSSQILPMDFVRGRVLKICQSKEEFTQVQTPRVITSDALTIAYGGYKKNKLKPAIGFYRLNINSQALAEGLIFETISRGYKIKELSNTTLKNLKISVSGQLSEKGDIKWNDLYDSFGDISDVNSFVIKNITNSHDNTLEGIRDKLRASMDKESLESYDKQKKAQEEYLRNQNFIKITTVDKTENSLKEEDYAKRYSRLLRQKTLGLRTHIHDISQNHAIKQIYNFLYGTKDNVLTNPYPCIQEDTDYILEGYTNEILLSQNNKTPAPLLIVMGHEGMGKRTIVHDLSRRLKIPLRKNNPDELTTFPDEVNGKEEIIVFEEAGLAVEFSRKGFINKYPILIFETKDPVETIFGTMKQDIPEFQYLDIPYHLIKIDRKYYHDEMIANELINSILTHHNYTGEKVEYSLFTKNKVPMTPKAINAVIVNAKNHAKINNEALDRDALSFALHKFKSNTKVSNPSVNVIRPKKTLDDLVINPEQRQEIEQIIENASATNNSNYLFLKNLRDRSRIIALFSGHAGTGKSMSAEVIANALGRELWQCEFSRMQGKYVGETETALTTLFEEAELSGAVLLLDECDAFLRNRSMVDGFSSKIVNHLLNLINNYNGILILTSNFAETLDSAFDRRIKYKIDFKKPDLAQKIAILKNLLYPDAPVEENMDWEALLKDMDLSGGLILNAVEKAISLMNKEKSPILTFSILRRSLEEVYRGSDSFKNKRKPMGLVS